MNHENLKFPDTLVVTATLGDRPSLFQTIESVKKIGKKRVTHVVIAPEDKCKGLKEQYPSIQIIHEPLNCTGIYGALNYAFKKYAKEYKYLTFINDDDYWLNDYDGIFKEMDKGGQDVIYGRVNYIDSKGEIIGEQTSSPRYKAFTTLLKQGIVLFTQQATLIKSELFIKMEGFNEKYKLIADTDFWLRAINSNAKFQYINLLCAAYTIQEGQLSSNNVLQAEEYNLLELGKSNNSNRNPIFEIFLFRLFNFRIYFERIKKFRSIPSMSSFFHSKK